MLLLSLKSKGGADTTSQSPHEDCAGRSCSPLRRHVGWKSNHAGADYVGFRFPYTQAHIPGSEYFGPSAHPAVVQQLREHAEGLARNRFIVIYCGCCPWSHCPNVKPAYEAFYNLGFTRLKVLYIPDNLGTDWVNRGYPIEKGE
jgi:hypothetical protein